MCAVVCAVSLGADPIPADKAPPTTVPSAENLTKTADDDSKSKDEDENKKSILNQVDPESIQQITTTLSSTVAALIAIQTIPGSVQNSGKAIRELWNFGEHRAEYLRQREELTEFMKTKDKKLAVLNKAIERYSPALKELDEHVKSVLGGQPPELGVRYNLVEQDIQSLMELPGASRWSTELMTALDEWRADHRSYPIESWIGKHLGTKFLKAGPGAAWLERYTKHQKELAAAYWLEKGSALLMDQWSERNKGRVAVFNDEEKKWQKQFKKLRADETKAAGVFIREFATFTRDLNDGIHDPKHKFSELLLWANREPGVFHTSDSGAPIPITADKMAQYAGARCAAGFKALSDAVAAARMTGALTSIPWQILRSIAPGLGAGVTGVTGYMSVRGLIRLWQKAKAGELGGEEKDEKEPKKG